MAHPKRRTSRSKKKMRRSHHALSEKTVIVCSYCGEMMISHRVCPECGYYNGIPVLKTAEDD